MRRVGIVLTLYGVAFDHAPWSTFGDVVEIAPYNPLLRVPVLVRPDGESLIETSVIIDCLDEDAGAAALVASSGAARRQCLKLCALSGGIAEKAVALIYARIFNENTSPAWIDRGHGQIAAGLDALQHDFATVKTPYWQGDTIGHADIAFGCAWGFLQQAHPGVFASDRWQALAAHAARLETLPAFAAVTQAFIPPK